MATYKDLSKNIADKISFFQSLWSNIKINLKENENKLTDENLKYYEKQYSMLEIKRQNYISKKRFEIETNIHKTFMLNMLILLLSFISVCLTLLGTNVLDNLFTESNVLIIKSVLTIFLMFSIMFISYYLSSQLSLIKEKFNHLFKVSIVIILACITVSVYFNFMFLQSILTIDNDIIKLIIALLKSILLDISISVLLYYRNCRKTLSFTYEHNKTYVIPDKTYVNQDKTEVKTESKTENKIKTETKHTLTFDKKLEMIKNILLTLPDDSKIDFNSMKHFLSRYDWDKAKKILINEKLIYINKKQCRKSPVKSNIKVVK